jgi:hypothetical protein
MEGNEKLKAAFYHHIKFTSLVAYCLSRRLIAFQSKVFKVAIRAILQHPLFDSGFPVISIAPGAHVNWGNLFFLG